MQCAVVLLFLAGVTEPVTAQYAYDVRECARGDQDPDLALEHCSRALAAGGLSGRDRLMAYIGRGDAYYRKLHYRAAIQAYSAAIGIDRSSSLAFSGRGMAHWEMEERDEAMEDWAQALRLDPTNADALGSRGRAFLIEGKFDRALSDLDDGLRVDPSSVEMLTNRAIVHLARGELDRAIEDYDRALALQPEKVIALNGRGCAYLFKGEFDRARRDLDEAIRLSPDYAEAMNNRGVARLLMRDFDGAFVDLSHAIHLGYRGAYFRRGFLHLTLARFTAATSDFEAAGPERADVAPLFRLASVRAGASSLGDEDRERSSDSSEWPRPLTAMYMGRIKPENVLSLAERPDPGRAVHVCAAWFHIGEYWLIKGSPGRASDAFHAATSVCPRWCPEGVAAAVELERLEPGSGERR